MCFDKKWKRLIGRKGQQMKNYLEKYSKCCKKEKSKLDWSHLEKELSTEINSGRKDRRRQWQKEDEEEEYIIYL